MPVSQPPSVEEFNHATLSAVELVPFGDRTLGHSTENGSIVLLNDTARIMLQSIQDTGDRRAAVERLVAMLDQDRTRVQSDLDTLLMQWTNAGLFADNPMALLAGARLTNDCAWSTYVKLSRKNVQARSNDAAAGSILQRALEPLLTDFPDNENDDVVDLIELSGTYLVAVNGKSYWSSEDFASCRHMFLQALLETALGQGAAGAVLHASAVRIGKNSLIISGASGSGKSTLMSQLVLAGGDYVGDDLVALSPSGEGIFGLPANISVKPGSIEILNRQLADLDKPFLPRADEYALTYWETNSAQSWQKPTHLCFPKFRPDLTSVQVDKLDPLAALNRLLDAGARTCGLKGSIKSMASVCQSIPAFALEYGAGEDAMTIIEEVMS